MKIQIEATAMVDRPSLTEIVITFTDYSGERFIRKEFVDTEFLKRCGTVDIRHRLLDSMLYDVKLAALKMISEYFN